jgi:hypothetical protein
MDSDLTSMQDYWDQSFPPIERPWLLPLWLLRVHASDMTAYPAGGPAFASSLSLVVWIAGIAYLVRRRQRTLLAFSLAPLLLTFVAAALHKYPYGGHFKFTLFLAPWMCLILGCGLTPVAEFLARRLADAGLSARAVVRGLLLGLASIALVTSVRDVVWPYKSIGDWHDRAFAQWFWDQANRDGEAACSKFDFGIDPSPATYEQLNYSAVYRCNMAIYSDRHRRRRPIAWDRISEEHPLVCTIYYDPWEPFDPVTWNGWMAEMKSRFELTETVKMPMQRKDHSGRKIVSDAYVEAYRFVPR